jgi:predicted glycoside hydrolase/deacetylase ChbG (UPF0249 family)
MMKYLIVNADDYGHTPGISAGIRKAYLEGIVTSTSAMMNGTHIEAELPKLIALCPRIGIGVHLVLTHGNPLLPVSSLPTLMSLSIDGRTFNHDPLAQIDRIDLQEVRAEWQAQIEKFIRLTGHAPDHLDAHHHAMCFGERYFEIYLELADKYGCAVRRPVDGSPDSWLEQNKPDHKVPMPDRLDTRFYDEGISEAMLEQMIGDISEGTTEWMCHPGVVDEEILAISDYNTRRADELMLLTRSELRSKLEADHVTLISFDYLRGPH